MIFSSATGTSLTDMGVGGGDVVLWVKVEFVCNILGLPDLLRINSRERHRHGTLVHKHKARRHKNHEDYSNTGDFITTFFIIIFHGLKAGAGERARGSRNR